MRLNEMVKFCFYNARSFLTLDTWNNKANFRHSIEIAYDYKNINMKNKCLNRFKKVVRSGTI